MNKPGSLRDHLMTAVPALHNNPDRLLVFIDKGSVRCTLAASLSFEYSYKLQLILTDFPGHPDSVILPLLGWLRVNQSELLANLEQSAHGIQFEVDILDHEKVDMAITLPLTERVVVSQNDDASFTVTHASEPPYTDPALPNPATTLYAGGQLLASWPALNG